MLETWQHLRIPRVAKDSCSRMQISRRERSPKRAGHSRIIIWAKVGRHQQMEARSRCKDSHLKALPPSTRASLLNNLPQASLIRALQWSSKVPGPTIGPLNHQLHSLYNNASHGRTKSTHKHHKVVTQPQQLGDNKHSRKRKAGPIRIAKSRMPAR